MQTWRWRAGMIVRQATIEDAAGIARARIDTWRTTYRGIVPEDFLANMSYEENEQSWTKRLSDTGSQLRIFVAENEPGQIVGFVSGGPNRYNDPIYKGELHAIYILQPYQGQGIGRRLTLALVERLLQMGID